MWFALNIFSQSVTSLSSLSIVFQRAEVLNFDKILFKDFFWSSMAQAFKY
jgi:hypothetical protein